MIIIGLGVALLAGLIVCARGYKRTKGSCENIDWSMGVIFLGIGLVALLLAIPFTYAGNAARIAELDAFQEANTQNYATTVTQTEAILSQEDFLAKLVAGSLEKIEVGKSISERVVEWRDAVNSYNLEVARKQRIRTLWIYPGWLVMPPEVNELPLLRIG